VQSHERLIHQHRQPDHGSSVLEFEASGTKRQRAVENTVKHVHMLLQQVRRYRICRPLLVRQLGPTRVGTAATTPAVVSRVSNPAYSRVRRTHTGHFVVNKTIKVIDCNGRAGQSVSHHHGSESAAVSIDAGSDEPCIVPVHAI